MKTMQNGFTLSLNYAKLDSGEAFYYHAIDEATCTFRSTGTLPPRILCKILLLPQWKPCRDTFRFGGAVCELCNQQI